MFARTSPEHSCAWSRPCRRRRDRRHDRRRRQRRAGARSGPISASPWASRGPRRQGGGRHGAGRRQLRLDRRAVAEGRTVYDNLRKAILVPADQYREACDHPAGDPAGLTLPITPVQILWISAPSRLVWRWPDRPSPTSCAARRAAQVRHPGLPPGLAHPVRHGVADDPGFRPVSMVGVHHGAPQHRRRPAPCRDQYAGRQRDFYLWNARAIMNPVSEPQGIFGSRPVLISMVLCLLLQLLPPALHAPPIRHGSHRFERLGAAGRHRCGGLRDRRAGKGGGRSGSKGRQPKITALIISRVEDFVHDAEEPLGLLVAVFGEGAAPAGRSSCERRSDRRRRPTA